ncbi:DUF4148 domain-containing protein [Paraburkholderia sp. SIMBA_049]
MKHALGLFVIALGLSTPLLASAQMSSQGLTREQVRQEAAAYAAAGFNPARMNPRTWVDDAQAASVKVMTAKAEGANGQLADNKRDAANHSD